MIGKLALDLIKHPLSTLLDTVPGGRRLAPQGAWGNAPLACRPPGDLVSKSRVEISFSKSVT